MSITVFRNYDLKCIRNLLKEIGKERYECALKDAGLWKQKPLTMEGFFVEYRTDTQDVGLYYKYPVGVVYFILPVLGFWNVPLEHWVRERK